MLQNIKLSTKLIGGFLLVALITIIISIFSWINTSRLSGNINDITTLAIPSDQALAVISDDVLATKTVQRTLLIPELSQEIINQQYDHLKVYQKEIDQALKTYREIPHDMKEDELIKNMSSLMIDWQKGHDEFMKHYQEYHNNPKNQILYAEFSNHGFNTLKPSYDKLFAKIKELKKYRSEDSNKIGNTATNDAKYAKAFALVAMFIGSTLALVLAIFLSNSITRPMNSAVAQLNEGTQQVAAASNQLSSSAQQLSQGSAEQASAIEETSSTLQESTSMLQQNTANTKQAAQLAVQTKESSIKGSNEMQEMMNSMQAIKKSSDQIAKIIKVIDDIAFQTNILALNAAIEAARAGEAGMGFAVVAEEVRNLAQRSAQAAKDTTTIIESNIELSGKGVAVAERVREALSEITDQAKKVNELMDEISVASQEQAQGVDQVNKAMIQMETVTQQNAANAEESASASEELSAQADNMRKVVHELAQLVNGKVAAIQAEIEVSNREVHHSNRQKVEAMGTTRQALSPSDIANSSPRLSDRVDNRTKIISPEDIIPLEKDPNHF